MEKEPSRKRLLVSVILATFNEVDHIGGCVASLLDQVTPNFDIEILVVDGLSSDGTRQFLERIAAADPRVRVLTNKRRVTPHAFNMGLEEANGEYISILGSHTVYRKDYINVCLEELISQGVVACGGRVLTRAAANTLQARLVALALSHPFGSSRKSFRTQAEGFVDTVNYAVMRKQPLVEVGGYDEKLVRNQDNDMSHKLRARGYKLFCTWKTECIYYPKSNVKSLVRYGYRCGFWNGISLNTNPASMAPRHLIPALFVTALLFAVLFAAAGLLLPFSHRAFVVVPLTALLAVHLGAGLTAAMSTIAAEGLLCVLWLPMIFLAFHLAYGFGTVSALVIQAKPPATSFTPSNGSPDFRSRVATMRDN